MLKLATGNWSVASLSQEFGYTVQKKGQKKEYLDYEIVKKALTSLSDFSGEGDGFVKKTTDFTDGNWKGEHNRVWILTKKGILALTQIQEPSEFFEMIFFQYDNNYKHYKTIIELSKLIENYELNHQMFRDKINSEINIVLLNKVKNLFFTEDFKINIVPILKKIGLKKEMTDTEIKEYFENQEYEKTQYGILISCVDEGLIMQLDNNYCLSLFGFLSLISTYSIDRNISNKKLENEIHQIIDNHKFLFPKILNKKAVSIIELTQLFRKIFFGSFSIEDNESSLIESRMLVVQSYFEKIQQIKFRVFFKQFISAYQNWCDKQNCHVLPFSSDFKLSSFFSIDDFLDKEYMQFLLEKRGPVKKEIIKVIVDEKKHSAEFRIKGIHDDVLEYDEKSDDSQSLESFDPTDQDLYEPESKWKYEELLYDINNIIIDSLRAKSNELQGDIDAVLSNFSKNEKKILKQKINKAYTDIVQLLECKDLLCELSSLSDKIEKNNEFDTTIIQTAQVFDSLKAFSKDKNTKTMQNIIEFQFFTYLKSINPISFKNVFLKHDLSEWYSDWIKILIEFHKDESAKIQMYNLD